MKRNSFLLFSTFLTLGISHSTITVFFILILHLHFLQIIIYPLTLNCIITKIIIFILYLHKISLRHIKNNKKKDSIVKPHFSEF